MSEVPESELFYLPEEMPPERGPVEDIYKRKLKDRVDPPYRLQNQLKRCNILASRGDPLVFESAVRTLIGDLPYSVKTTVQERIENECTIVPPVIWKYIEFCGHRLGTTKKPFVTNDPNGIDYNPNEPSDPISPYEFHPAPYIDYEKVLGIVKEELEFGGGSWRYDKALKEMGSIPKELPAKVKKKLIDAILGVYLEHRAEGILYSWSDFLDNMRREQPRIPLLPIPEKEVNPKGEG